MRICAPNILALTKENVHFVHPIFRYYFMFCAPNIRTFPPPLFYKKVLSLTDPFLHFLDNRAVIHPEIRLDASGWRRDRISALFWQSPLS